MREKSNYLIMRLTDEAGVLEWIHYSSAGDVLAGPSLSHLSELVKLTKNATNILLVPSLDVILTDLNLPKANRHEVLSTTRYALEDKVLDDIDDLHFVIVPVDENPTPVGLIKRDKMQAWLAPFHKYHIELDRLQPEVMAVPYQADCWQIVIEKNYALVRTGEASGVAIDKRNLLEFLHWKLALDAEKAPGQLHLLNNTDQAFKSTVEDSLLSMEVSEDSFAESHLLRFAKAIIKERRFNFLEGDFKPKARDASSLKLFYIAAGLLVIALFSVFITSLVAKIHLKQENKTLDKQITAIYKQIFPEATSVVAPRQRVQQLLKKLNTNDRKSEFLKLFSPVAKVLPSHQAIRLETINFVSHRLSFTVSTKHAQRLSQFYQALQSVVADVKQQKVIAHNGAISAQFMVTGRQG